MIAAAIFLMSYYLPAGLFILFLLFVWSLSKKLKRRRAKKYLVYFTKYFQSTGNIRTTMTAITKEYSKRSKERKALEAGIYYLDHSLFCDYSSALAYVSDLFPERKMQSAIRKCHLEAVKRVQEQRQLSLPSSINH